MQTINCRIKVSEHQDLPGRSVTPAEVIVLFFLHNKVAGGHPIRNATKAGRALMLEPGGPDGKPTVRLRTSIEEYRRLAAYYKMRSSPDKPESSFLDDLFPGVKTGGAKLPETFAELPPPYKLKDPIGEREVPFVRTEDFTQTQPITQEDADALAEAQKRDVNPVATPGGQDAKTGKDEPVTIPQQGEGEPELGDISKLSKEQLLDLADDYNIKVDSRLGQEKLAAVIAEGIAAQSATVTK